MKTSPELRSFAVLSTVLLTALTAFILPRSAQGQARDIVSGNLIQFNDNGAWCWFQNERAVVDTAKGKLIVGSDASSHGVGGSPREGAVDEVIFDLQTGLSQRVTLKDYTSDSNFYADDHNTPGLLIRPDGKYLAVYTSHNTEKYSYWRVYDGTNWSAEQRYDWNTQPGGADFNTTYSNPYYLSAEGRTYDFARGAMHGSPNMIISTNYGDTWAYGGVLCTNQNVGYVNGYFNYWGNGVDRVDFVCTEYHPRDYNTSIYHGYVSNGMSFKSDGTLVDGNIFNKLAPTTPDFTRVFAASTVQPPGQTNTRCWNFDIQRYDDGTIAILFKTRINDTTPASSDPNHAFFYARYDGSTWTSTYLCKAGKKMYSSEEDYTGLGALCPNDPNTIFVSTPIDPRNGANLTVHEIFKGVTSDHGATWTWTPITQKSVRDNYRPIVPAWDGNNMALLWWRGTYSAAQNYDAAVVGIVTHSLETNGLMHYVDATTNNTFLTNGMPLVLSSAANQWHSQTGVGNGGTVISSADSTGENATNLMTQVTVPGAGTYDVWVNFWGNPAADWRIRAGLTVSNMQTYRSMACEEVQPGYHDTDLVLTNSTPANNYLYQAYVGRVVISNNYTITVFVDDNAMQTGGTTLVGNTCRTWYDGVSYAQVNPPETTTNTPPTLQPISDQTIDAGITLVITNVAYDTDSPPQTLTFSLLNGPANATLNSTNGVFSWRPWVSQADTTNAVSVQVADSGSPSLSATNNFNVIVNPLSQPELSSISVSPDQISLAMDGPSGPDYTILTSTNLVDWQMLLTTNSPLTPLTLVTTNLNDPMRFYRIQLGP